MRGRMTPAMLGRLTKRVGREVMIGAALLVAVIVIAAVIVVVYVNPPGKKQFTFLTDDVSSVAVGQDVRVAGLNVGKVTGLELGANEVRVTAEVDEEIFIGDRSRVEVRMLTPVGGYAATLIPLGDVPLGDTWIQSSAVSVPYSIGDVIQEVPTVTDNVDAADIDGNLGQVADALGGQSPSLRDMVDGMRSVTGVIARQRSQVDAIAALSTEYLEAFEANRAFIFDLLRQTDIVLSTYNNTHVGFNEAYARLGRILMSIQPLEAYYLDHSDQVVAAINQFRQIAETAQNTMGPAIDKLTALRDQLAGWLGPEGIKELKGGTVLASDICIPVAGRKC